MKNFRKIVAIVATALMLCSILPISAFAADEPTIVVSTVEEANAGDEIEVSVQLLNNPGVVSAKVKIEYDPDVMELLTYYDEDEEMDMNMIEPASGWSSKYITWGPLGKCLMNFCNGTAKNPVTKEDFFTATFKIKEDAPSGTYPLTVVYDPNDFFALGSKPGTFELITFGKQDTTITINGTEPECEHEYNYDCDKVCKLCGEETRPEAQHEYMYACDATCMICYELTNENAAHNISKVDAVEASCQAPGNVEYWTCEYCGYAWLDEACTLVATRFSVIVPMKDHEYMYPCDATCMNCGELTNENAVHNTTKVDAVEATCQAPGNVEYWTCADCGAAWLDEACTIVANQMNVIVPATGAHTYDDDYDADCNVCGEIREIVNPIVVLYYQGASVSEDVNGLAFQFSVAASDVVVENGNEFVSGTVSPFDNYVPYTLKGMGAVVSNQADVEPDLSNLNGNKVKDAPALLLCDADAEDDGEIGFAVRIVNIPNVAKNVIISARPYFIYEMDGEEIVVYGDTVTGSYAAVLATAE